MQDKLISGGLLTIKRFAFLTQGLILVLWWHTFRSGSLAVANNSKDGSWEMYLSVKFETKTRKTVNFLVLAQNRLADWQTNRQLVLFLSPSRFLFEIFLHLVCYKFAEEDILTYVRVLHRHTRVPRFTRGVYVIKFENVDMHTNVRTVIPTVSNTR